MNSIMKRMMREDVQAEATVRAQYPRSASWWELKSGLFTNSTQIITDMGTVITNITSTQQTRAIAAGGPILDVNAICEIVQLRFQEAKVLCNYLLYGNQIASGSVGGASSIVASGDGTIYTTLLSVYNILT